MIPRFNWLASWEPSSDFLLFQPWEHSHPNLEYRGIINIVTMSQGGVNQVPCEGQITLTQPFECSVGKPANAELPYKATGQRATRDWIAKVDRLANHATKAELAAYYYAAALQEALTLWGPENYSTLCFEQGLATNLFDSGQAELSVKFFSDIIAQCRKIKEQGDLQKEIKDDILDATVICLYVQAGEDYKEKNFRKAFHGYQRVHQYCIEFSLSAETTSSVASALETAKRAHLEARQRKAASTEHPPQQGGSDSRPSTPRHKVDDLAHDQQKIKVRTVSRSEPPPPKESVDFPGVELTSQTPEQPNKTQSPSRKHTDASEHKVIEPPTIGKLHSPVMLPGPNIARKPTKPTTLSGSSDDSSGMKLQDLCYGFELTELSSLHASPKLEAGSTHPQKAQIAIRWSYL